MSFKSGLTKDHELAGAGEKIGTGHVILSESKFEDGLLAGRFAKLDSNQIDSIDGSTSPVIAGVVLRHVTGALDSEAPINNAFCSTVNIVRCGLVTVRVKDGQTPAKFGAVHVSNSGNEDDGKAITTGGVTTSAEFIEEYAPNVWLIRLV